MPGISRQVLGDGQSVFIEIYDDLGTHYIWIPTMGWMTIHEYIPHNYEEKIPKSP